MTSTDPVGGFSVARAGSTHQQELADPQGSRDKGYIKGRCEETGEPSPLPPTS